MADQEIQNQEAQIQETKNKDQVVKTPNDDGADTSAKEPTQHLSFLETTQSVLYAFLGVQKSKNAKRDFSKGKASHFIVLGITFGILFVLSVALVVKVILDQVAR